MKRKTLLFGAIFTILGFVARAQVYEMYYQGFESDEAANYTVTPAANAGFSTDLVVSGSQALKLTQLQTGSVEVITDTIDFSQNTSLTYVALEFDHILNVQYPQAALGYVYVKRVGQSDWTQLTVQYYDQTGSYSTQFSGVGNFNRNSYGSTWIGNNMTNECWKHERFNINTFLGSDIPVANRKLIFRFEMKKPNGSNTVQDGQAWWIDNIRVRASQNQMVKPIISMFDYPDGGAYPNSRGANIVLDARTTVVQGINADSVYLYYTVGSDPTPIRMNMTSVGTVTSKDGNTWSRFKARLPFEGYDTLMRFYCVVKDATTNYNEATFPDAANSWITYWYTRGTEQLGVSSPSLVGTENYQYFPFPVYARNRSEWVLDSALLASAGYGPGAITDLRFMVGTATTESSRSNFQFRMKNVPTSYEIGSADRAWTTSYMRIVYDSTLTIPALAAGEEFTVHLKDTFYYAGGDIVMSAIYNNATNVSSANIKMITTPATKKSKVSETIQNASDPTNDNPFIVASVWNQAQSLHARRPAIVMTQHANMPLFYDLGVSSFAFPTYTTPIMSVPADLKVWLRNYGAQTVNGVRISYTIDDSIPGYFDWSQALPAGDSMQVTISSTVNLPAGYHYVRAWVEDTLTVGTNHYRDHEPLNDTCWVEFIVCEGPLSGVRQIGGTGADYNTIEEFLFSLSRCGIDDSLVVKLAPGYYPAFKMPVVNGHTVDHYIVFESLDPASPATLYSDTNCMGNYIVDLTDVKNMRFRNLNFVRRNGALTSMIGFAATTDSCRIEGCYFVDSLENISVTERIAALVSTNNANNTTFEGNTFEGGQIGISITGQSNLSTGRSHDNVVRGNVFRNQNNNAVKVENQDDIIVDHNEMYDVLTNQSYVVQMLECYGTIELTGNKIYTSHGAGAIGLSGLNGTATNHAIVANNMIVCNDDGLATQLTTPLNVISATWTDVVYNSVKMTAPNRNNIAAASFGGGAISNSRFMNNIVANYSATNFALNYTPGTETSNKVSNNVYYSTGINLNRRQGVFFNNLASWSAIVEEDTVSIKAEPVFLEGSRVDLRTFNRILKGVAAPIPEVNVDIFDSIRDTVSPCPGAFEFEALFYDFEPLALMYPEADVCDMPDTVELRVQMRNTGTHAYVSGGNVQLDMVYRVNNGVLDTVSIVDSIPAEDTITINTGIKLHLPSNGTLDAQYKIDVWTLSPSDPNQTNDTNSFMVLSRYQANAPDSIVDSIDYLTADTIVVTEGVDMWSVYDDTAAPKVPSVVSWYYNANDDEPFLVGNMLITNPLRQDTTFYIKQQRAIPIVRITQVLIGGSNAVGLGTLPSWFKTTPTNSRTQLAVQLTNVGDDTAHLQGDTLRTVSTKNTYNNKYIKFGDVSLAPGQSIVVQFNTGNSNDYTLFSGSRITPAITENLALIYRHNGKAEDAVALNGIISESSSLTPTWATQGVPSYVWSGDAIEISGSTVGGLIRQSFTGTSADWLEATSVVTLNLENTEPSWLRYVDNGCPGGVNPVQIFIGNPPAADVEVTALPLAEGCGLGDEPVSVAIHNYGNMTVDSIVLNYAIGTDTITDTMFSQVAANGDGAFTFGTPVNLAFDKDSVVDIKIWVTAVDGDPQRDNDTTIVSTTSLFTSAAPDVDDTLTLQYGRSHIISFDYPEDRIPVWYDYDMNPADTAYSYQTDVLYTNGTVGLSYMVAVSDTGRIGLGNNITNKTNYPSPYQPNNKYVKQQYIYSKSELTALGLGRGAISAVAFHLDSINAGKDSLVFKNYSIYMGMTTDTIFKSNGAWKEVSPYYERDTFLLVRSYIGNWVWHELDNLFMWDGESSVVVQVMFENDTTIKSGVQTQYTSKSNTSLHKAVDNPLSPSLAEYVTDGNRSSNRPNIRIAGSTFGCNGPVSIVHIILDSVPGYDATLSWPAGIDTISYTSCANVEPQIRIRNLGANPIEGMRLHYFIDNDTVADTTLVLDTIATGAYDTVQLFSKILTPGHHSIKVVADADGDSIVENDTISTIVLVRFCGGTYSIGADSLADFHSFGAAIDTLNAVGITGPVVFSVDSGLYNECVELGDVYGSSSSNRISFVGTTDSAGVVLMGNTSAATPNVFRMSGTSHVTLANMCIISRPTVASVKDANALNLDSCTDVLIQNCILRVKGSLYDTKASALVLSNGCSNVSVIGNQIDSGYCAIKTVISDNRYEGLIINNNTFNNFQARGIEVNGVTALNIAGNTMNAAAGADGRGMVGISLTNVDSTISVTKNKIYLLDNHNGSKCGMYFNNVMGTGMYNGLVANNMISTNGTGTTGLSGTGVPKNPSGIYIEGSTSYINFFFNTVRVCAGNSQANTRAFYVAADPTNIQVMSNLLTNYSQSHAYYVTSGASILSSDYNAFYTTGTTKFVYWGAEKSSLTALQAASLKDENSVSEEPYFTSPSDLHLLMTNFCGKAQYTTDVMDDIDGKARPQLPQPTVGAHEMDRLLHNMTVVRIISPVMPANKKNPLNIEGDSVLVSAVFYNNGISSESDVSWYAYIVGQEASTTTPLKSLGSFNPTEIKTDSVWLHPSYGIIDDQTVRVVLVVGQDEDTTDNNLSTMMYLAPAFDIEVVKIQSSASGCNATDAQMTLTIKNVGFKDIPATTSFDIGYSTQAYSPKYISSKPDSNKITLSTLPGVVVENYSLDAQLNKNMTKTITFETHANLYPTGMTSNIEVRVVGWANYQYDIINDNDTTGSSTNSSPVVKSYYTPNPPQGNDTTVYYGTTGQFTASQENGLKIRWYKDPTSNTPFYTGSNYANSCVWNTTPQYFHDSIYYLQCISSESCTSEFSTLTVHVAPKVQKDAAVEAILAPLGNRVYMENDTVRVRIANYGTQSISNIPVTFQLRKGNGTAPIQQVTQTCTANIGVNQTYVYTFDSLLHFASATTGSNYQLRVWTDMATDMVRGNDTIRLANKPRPANANNTELDYAFKTLAESTYPSCASANHDKLDIIRVTFNEIDVELPPLGRKYTNLGVFNNPEVPVLHVRRGMTDSIFISITNPTDIYAIERGKVAVYIDFNRNGSFSDSTDCVVPATNLYNNDVLAAAIAIPNNASLGYMKMRISASTNEGTASANLSNQDGHIVDFLIFVDAQMPSTDLSLMQIVNPRSYLIRDGLEKVISFRMSNRGNQPISAVDINYTFDNDEEDSVMSGVVNWTGNLMPGTSTVVELPGHAFNVGTTDVTIWHTLTGDENKHNDTLRYEYHRFHTITLEMNDDFDSLKHWYAPVGYNEYTRNYWEHGTPSKSRINGAHSAPNAWVTDLDETVTTGKRGNVSYLYSPIINIAQIRPDTISFYMRKNLLNNSLVRLEYYNFQNRWINTECDSIDPETWYNHVDIENGIEDFNGSDAASSTEYKLYSFPTSLISSNFNERLQFRFVFSTPQGTSDNASYGEGCAIDDIKIGRARRRIDLGVIEITKPVDPKYGQSLYPEVVVKNFGLDTITQVRIGYTTYGVHLARVSTFNRTLAPLQVDTFLLNAPIVFTSDFPDTIILEAFTDISQDAYGDNDMAIREYHITPLDNDISAEEFISPRDRVIAGDSVAVTMRIQNFGANDISNVRLTYMINGTNRVDEDVDIVALLGHPLAAREYMNYTFTQKFRAMMGAINVIGIAKCDTNDYIYNDTIHKRINGLAAITDLAAAAIIYDTLDFGNIQVELVIENRGARGANDFEVGYFIDGDTNNIVREIYHTYMPLPALSTGYHVFEAMLHPRTVPYDSITAFVNVLDDNDSTNDSTSEFGVKYVDLQATAIVVEENARPDCRVFMRVRNNGNLSTVGRTVRLEANVDGNTLMFAGSRRIDPGSEVLVELNRTIPKNPLRRYVGSGTVTVVGDANPANDQTTNVVVSNYVEGTPSVNAGQFTLEQNYPNPFSHQTTIPFSLAEAATVRLFVIDATGHIVYQMEKFYPAGDAKVTLDMEAFPAGVYFYGIETTEGRLMRKMILR